MMLRPMRTTLYCCQQLLQNNSVEVHSSCLTQQTNKQQAEINNSARIFRDEVNRFIFGQRRINIVAFCSSGPGSAVGIATGYGLDGPRIESRWERDFPHLSRPALGPTQPPVQWVPGLFRE